MQSFILYSFSTLLIGTSALLAAYGFVHASLPDQALAILLLLVGAGLVRATWRVEHAPNDDFESAP